MQNLNVESTEIISRKIALKNGLKTYYTGKKCPNEHLCNRYVANYACVECMKINAIDWKDSNPERINELKRISHSLNYNNYKEKKANYYIINKKSAILALAKNRAIKKGMDFNITIDAILWPDVCPVLGIKIDYEVRGSHTNNSPTLDRLDNTLGYVIGNVNVISFRANSLKSNATYEEIKKLSDFMSRKCGI